MLEKNKIKRVGILTGGGDCPGLNAVIRAVAKAAINQHSIEIIGILDGFRGFVENDVKELHYDDVSGILTQGGTILGTSNRHDPFQYAEKKGDEIVFHDRSDEGIENCRKLGLDALVCIGGDGTLSIANKLFKKGMNIIGVPKTIDNDLCETDVTFGFDSAVSTIADAIDKIHTTAQSHHRVMIIETMGRYAGWLALKAGIAGGGDIILIPEIPYDVEKVCQRVKERSKHGKRFSIVVVAEGAKPKGGDMVVKRKVEGSHDPIRLGGIGNSIAKDIEEICGLETRVTVLGHLQRGGTPTAFDRVLATQFGMKAMDLIVKGDFGKMAALKGQHIAAVPIEKAVNRLRLVPVDSPLIATARAVGTSFGD